MTASWSSSTAPRPERSIDAGKADPHDPHARTEPMAQSTAGDARLDAVVGAQVCDHSSVSLVNWIDDFVSGVIVVPVTAGLIILRSG